jgi:hypothetical protein
MPVGTGVAEQVELVQELVGAEKMEVKEAFLWNEVDSQVELLEALATLEAFNALDIVDGKVEIRELFQAANVLNSGDEVALKVEDLEVAADGAKKLDTLELLLVERYFPQRGDLALIVLSASAQQLHRYARHATQSLAQTLRQPALQLCVFDRSG